MASPSAYVPGPAVVRPHVYRNGDVDPDVDDAVLARLVRVGGDQRAAGILFDRHAPVVRRILTRTLGPFYEVEDHVQETFVHFFRQLGGLKNDDALRAFVVSIAVRTARHELRRRRVRKILHLSPPEELSDFAEAAPDVDHEGREALRRLFAILDSLDTSSRLAFTLRHLEEMELMEVAVALGESLASVKRRLARVTSVVNARAAVDSALSVYVKETSDV
jgi:RNA polymerase sigma-70 factor (ECF subfamily)